MSLASASRLKALILVLMAIFFASLLGTGRLYDYIGPRLSWLAVLAVVMLILLAGAYDLVRRRASGSGGDPVHESHESKASIWPMVVMALPLVLGVVMPARPLGASAISTRGLSSGPRFGPSGSASAPGILPAERTILDWIQAMSANPDPAALDGQRADMIGFVYHDARLGEDQFMVARFTLICCVADAQAIGLVVESPEAAGLAADSWVRVQGVFQQGEVDGEAMPILTAEEITPIQPPEQPYLYP